MPSQADENPGSTRSRFGKLCASKSLRLPRSGHKVPSERNGKLVKTNIAKFEPYTAKGAHAVGITILLGAPTIFVYFLINHYKMRQRDTNDTGISMTRGVKTIRHQSRSGMHIQEALIEMWEMCHNKLVIDFIVSEDDLRDKWRNDMNMRIDMSEKMFVTYIMVPNPNIRVTETFNHTRLVMTSNTDLDSAYEDFFRKQKRGCRHRLSGEMSLEQAVIRYRQLKGLCRD